MITLKYMRPTLKTIISLVVKNLPANAGAPGLVPGWGRSPGEGKGYSILARRIPWTEEPGGVQSMGSKRVKHN